jgi:hypothetical protein
VQLRISTFVHVLSVCLCSIPMYVMCVMCLCMYVCVTYVYVRVYKRIYVCMYFLM